MAQQSQNWREREKQNPLLDTRSTDEVRENLSSLADGNAPIPNTKLDKKKQEQALQLIHKTMGMNTKVIRDQHDIETTRQVYARETLVIQNCHDCKYTVFGQCAIIMVTDCNNFTLTVDANVRTHVMELWRCNNVTLKVNTMIQTLQVDMSNNVDIHYKRVKDFRDVVWSASEELVVAFGDSDDTVHTGYSLAKPHYPHEELTFDKTQFFIRYIDDILRIEKVLRLSNGFATTKREHAKWKARQDQKAFDLAEKWGIKIHKKPAAAAGAIAKPADPLAVLMGAAKPAADPFSSSLSSSTNASDVMRLFNSAV